MRLTTDPRRGASQAPADVRVATPWAVAGVAAGLLLTFVLDRRTDAAPVQHLYYLPIVLASVRLRWVGGLIASLTAIVLYHLANPTLLTFAYHETDLVQIALFIAVGVVTSRLTENARRLHVIAMTDDLTGLHNLRSFEARLTPMIRAARLGGGSLWMLVLDLDRLKSLNDTHGHLTGAEAVRHVGRTLSSRLPVDAVACRHGGDEFAVCLAGRTEADARTIANDLCRAVSASAPMLAGRPFPASTLSISIGVAHRSWATGVTGGAPAAGEAMERPDAETDDEAGEALFRAADSALYDAKSRGRNQVFFAPDSTSPRAGRRSDDDQRASGRVYSKS
jgi:diguanylate cyclase (GGDEF)-like protein